MRQNLAGVLHRVAPLGLVLLVVSACHIKLVSDYDDNFVQAAVSTEKEISTLLQNLRNPPIGTDITYKGNIANYNKVDVDMNHLAVLSSSHENNAASIAQVNKVIEIVHGLETLHRDNTTLSPAFVTQKQQDIDLAFAIVIRTENDKKAGM
ncbi:MAG: hypothetical protein JO001_25845 [Alphaproteobacteria bacterium]|nr:hypothetical protein [Alphaproteobacteria bacterium]